MKSVSQRAGPAPSLGGFALLDVVLAVALFAITVTGLVQVLQGINETSTGFARDRAVQRHMEAVLNEKRRLPLPEMASEAFDERLGASVRTWTEPFEADNAEGRSLADLHRLVVEIAFPGEPAEMAERVELIVHSPES